MRRSFSAKLLSDVLSTVQLAARRGSVMDISALAEQVRQRNETDNVALEDILEAMMQQAQWLGLSIEFSGEHMKAPERIPIRLD